MAELHRKQYPYPDEFVYLVVGGDLSNGQLDLQKLLAEVIVGRSPEVVQQRWKDITGSVLGWETLTCMSLAQIRPLNDLMEAAIKNPSSCVTVPKSGFFSIGKNDREPWVVVLEDSAANSTESKTVFSHDANDIDAWAKSKNKTVQTAMPYSMLQVAMQMMDDVRMGRAESEHYVREGPDWDDANKRIAEYSDEKNAQLLALAKSISATHGR